MRTDVKSARHHAVTDRTEKNIQTIADLEKSSRVQRTRGEMVIDVITRYFGEIQVVYVHLAFFVFWILFNTLMPKAFRFDPYPFEFLVFTLSLEAIFLSIFILITQNRQQEIDDRRNHLDLQINLLSEQENTKVIWMIKQIAEKVGVDFSDDPDLRFLEEATEPGKLIEQIDQSMKEKSNRN